MPGTPALFQNCERITVLKWLSRSETKSHPARLLLRVEHLRAES
jgi:hypothetical protein